MPHVPKNSSLTASVISRPPFAARSKLSSCGLPKRFFGKFCRIACAPGTPACICAGKFVRRNSIVGSGPARSVDSLSLYSKERLKNPSSVNGMPTFPATVTEAPSPAKYSPYLSERLPPSLSSLSRKLRIPPIASEPYCADAPSRSTSTCLIALDGI